MAVTWTFAILATPVSADTHTIYMTSKNSCQYDCAIVVMQTKGNKVRFKMSMDQAGGISSVGWMRRRGNTVKGLVGGFECYKPTKETRRVSGRGSRTHFTGMRVTSRAKARAFGKRHCGVTCGIPEWQWKSMKQWRADYAKFCD
jgi:hypothetical protein